MDYITIYEPSEDSFIEKKSKFIGYIAPVQTNEEAIAFIEKIKAMHRKATHNVYAYVLRKDNTSRYSDDGEPQGTAGVPVLDVINKEGLTDVCIVVTRYFGGIMLGGGGLVRAYSHSASIAIKSARKMDMKDCYKLDIFCDYSLYGKITYILPEYTHKMISTDFSDDVKISLYIIENQCEDLKKKLIDISNANIKIEQSDKTNADFN